MEVTGLSWSNEVSPRQNPGLLALLSPLEPPALWMPWVKASFYLGWGNNCHWVKKKAEEVLKHVADGDLFIPWPQSPCCLLSSSQFHG